jgi:Domain of unknown function (DUF4292)
MNNNQMKTIRFITLLCIICLFLPAFTSETGGCTRKDKTDNSLSLPATTKLTAPELVKLSTTRYTGKYKTMHAQLHGSSESDRMGGLDFSGNIYWEKDSLIWISLRKFGFEGMRAQITPRTITVLNRLEKTVMIRDSHWLEAEYGIVDGWAMLQAMLMNEPFILPKADKKSEIKDSLHLLTQREGDNVIQYHFSHGDYRLQRLEINELKRQITVRCTLSDWAEIGSKAFSSRKREFFMYSPDNGNMKVGLKFEKVEFDKARSLKFEIPDHYERI